MVDGFIEFIGDADLVIHNAAFDLGFINAELERLGHSGVDLGRAIDTVQMARSEISRRTGKPGCALPTFRDRLIRPHEAWGVARR